MIRLAVILCLLALAACGSSEVRPQPQPEPSPLPALADLGVTLTWVGGICAAGGIALRIVSLFYPPLAFLGAVAGFAGIGGAAVTVTGASCQYLADRPILVLAAALACVVAMGWWYWPGIRRALDRRLAGKG